MKPTSGTLPILTGVSAGPPRTGEDPPARRARTTARPAPGTLHPRRAPGLVPPDCIPRSIDRPPLSPRSILSSSGDFRGRRGPHDVTGGPDGALDSRSGPTSSGSPGAARGSPGGGSLRPRPVLEPVPGTRPRG